MRALFAGNNGVPGQQPTVALIATLGGRSPGPALTIRTVEAVSVIPTPETGAISESDVIPDVLVGQVDLHEAARQLELAEHDIRVALSCIGLGNLERAHEHAITARAAAEGAENMLRMALSDGTAAALWPDGDV